MQNLEEYHFLSTFNMQLPIPSFTNFDNRSRRETLSKAFSRSKYPMYNVVKVLKQDVVLLSFWSALCLSLTPIHKFRRLVNNPVIKGTNGRQHLYTPVIMW